MKCIIIAAVVSCTDPTPQPSPAEALQVLTQSVKPFEYRAPLPPAPTSVGMTSNAGRTPWEWTPERPERRLDGTLLTDPPQVYGWPWSPYYFGWSGLPGVRSEGCGRWSCGSSPRDAER